MNLPLSQHYVEVAYCLPCGELGCEREYWEENAGCFIEGDEMVVYYYNESVLADGESDTWQHAITTLKSTYLYDDYGTDGKLVILNNSLPVRNVPQYLVGLSNDDNSEVVFVGGYNLDKLKFYANSIELK